MNEPNEAFWVAFHATLGVIGAISALAVAVKSARALWLGVKWLFWRKLEDSGGPR